jgi:hypothetical protein
LLCRRRKSDGGEKSGIGNPMKNGKKGLVVLPYVEFRAMQNA